LNQLLSKRSIEIKGKEKVLIEYRINNSNQQRVIIINEWEMVEILSSSKFEINLFINNTI
jgi:hypothetical protein